VGRKAKRWKVTQTDTPARERTETIKNEKNLPRIRQLSQHELRIEAERLVRNGKMPSLDELCRAIAEARIKCGPRLRKARREAKLKVAVN